MDARLLGLDPTSGGYYWVPGTWVMAPAVGLLWTPGYWGWGNGGYVWNTGYWGPQVGFYGGVDYGYGYNGSGFYGGRWNGGYFSYNTAVMHVNRTVIHNTYVDNTYIRNVNVNRVSYNGGHGGIMARPTAAQEAAAHARRFGPRPDQEQQRTFARQERANFASENHGHPAYAATARPVRATADFKHAVPASGARPVNVNETRPVKWTPRPECTPGERNPPHEPPRVQARIQTRNPPANDRDTPRGTPRDTINDESTSRRVPSGVKACNKANP